MKMVDPNEKAVVKGKKNNINTEQIQAVDSTTQVAESKDNFWEITDLPSKFKLYPAGTKIYGRPLKVLEIKKLSTLDENTINSIINDILNRAIKGIAINKLLIADKLYLVFWLRANTYKDSGYSIAFKCPKCRADSTYNFSLNSLEIRYIKDNYNPDILIELPKTKDKISLKYLTVENETALEDFKKEYENILELNDEVLGVALSINKLNDKDLSLFDKYNYLINLFPSDYTYLEKYILKNDIGISPIMKAVCNKCGGKSQVGVTFRENFFVPDNLD